MRCRPTVCGCGANSASIANKGVKHHVAVIRVMYAVVQIGSSTRGSDCAINRKVFVSPFAQFHQTNGRLLPPPQRRTRIRDEGKG